MCTNTRTKTTTANWRESTKNSTPESGKHNDVRKKNTKHCQGRFNFVGINLSNNYSLYLFSYIAFLLHCSMMRTFYLPPDDDVDRQTHWHSLTHKTEQGKKQTKILLITQIFFSVVVELDNYCWPQQNATRVINYLVDCFRFKAIFLIALPICIWGFWSLFSFA